MNRRRLLRKNPFQKNGRFMIFFKTILRSYIQVESIYFLCLNNRTKTYENVVDICFFIQYKRENDKKKTHTHTFLWRSFFVNCFYLYTVGVT